MKRSRIVNAVLAVALIGTGIAIWSAVKSPASAKSTPVTVTAASGTVLSTVSASGTVQTSNQLNVNFQNSGTLIEVDVTAGQAVTQGQVLAKIDPTSAQQALTIAQAQLASAQAQLASAQAGGSTGGSGSLSRGSACVRASRLGGVVVVRPPPRPTWPRPRAWPRPIRPSSSATPPPSTPTRPS